MGPRRQWLALEPWDGGSHRHLIEGLAARLPASGGPELDVWTLPPRAWKWRMRGAAVTFARRWAAEAAERPGSLDDVAGLFTSSLLDVAALRGLLPPAARTLPLIVYFHENQLAYPVRVADRRDEHFGWTNAQSALAADRVLWNSAYNRDSFLEALERLVRRLPDHRPRGLADAIRRRSEVLPVPLDVRKLERTARSGEGRGTVPRVLWNHRWEHDKAPEVFFDALERLAGERLEFEVTVLGERFGERPPVFEQARERLGGRVARWGFVEDREAYARELGRCHVAVSTARHEFQGLAVLEAAACGAVPLVPDDLAYREIWPEEVRYRRGDLVGALRERIVGAGAWAGYDPRPVARGFDWEVLLPRWRGVFEALSQVLAGSGPGGPCAGEPSGC